MSLVESFHNLIQINQLANLILEENQLINDEENRIKKLKLQVSLKEEETIEAETKLNQSRKQISQLETEYENLTNLIHKDIDHLDRVTNNNQLTKLESNINANKEVLQRVEEELFNSIVQKEEFEEAITTMSGFIEGAHKTIESIEKEVDEFLIEHNRIKNNYVERIENLKEISDKNLKPLVEKLILEKVPLVSFVQKESCSVCRFTQDKSTLSELAQYKTFAQCTSCDRILLPEHLPHASD